MTIGQMEKYAAVVEAGSFSRAAEKLYLSPQALIQQIARMEQELGFKLLVRSAKGVYPSAAGRTMYQGVKALLAQYRLCVEQAQEQARTAATLRVGIPEHVNSTYLLSVCREFGKRYPEIQLHYKPYSRENTVRALLHEDVDVAAQIKPEEETAYCCEEIFPVKHYCIMAWNHPLAGRGDVALEDLRGCTVGYWGLPDSIHSLSKQIAAQGLDIQLRLLPENLSDTITFCLEGNVFLGAPPLIPQFKTTMAVLPARFDAGISYYIAYADRTNDAVSKFIAVAREVAKPERHPWTQNLQGIG